MPNQLTPNQPYLKTLIKKPTWSHLMLLAVNSNLSDININTPTCLSRLYWCVCMCVCVLLLVTNHHKLGGNTTLLLNGASLHFHGLGASRCFSSGLCSGSLKAEMRVLLACTSSGGTLLTSERSFPKLPQVVGRFFSLIVEGLRSLLSSSCDFPLRGCSHGLARWPVPSQ